MRSMDKSLYVGEYQHTLDDKHRLTIPSKWRFDGDEEDVYLALPNPCGCITIYPPNMVSKLSAKVAEVSLGNRKAQKALTRLFSQADHFGCDKQGRIKLSEKLVTHAHLAKDCILVGNFMTFSLWSPDHYKAYLDNDDDSVDEMAQILTELGV
jgi:MraZ protein